MLGVCFFSPSRPVHVLRFNILYTWVVLCGDARRAGLHVGKGIMGGEGWRRWGFGFYRGGGLVVMVLYSVRGMNVYISRRAERALEPRVDITA